MSFRMFISKQIQCKIQYKIHNTIQSKYNDNNTGGDDGDDGDSFFPGALGMLYCSVCPSTKMALYNILIYIFSRAGQFLQSLIVYPWFSADHTPVTASTHFSAPLYLCLL
jgi:hypothetical protein